ncbi:hypothetical protein Aduo_010628 [Ancylostoma duodenale]
MVIDVYKGIIKFLLSLAVEETTRVITGFDASDISKHVRDACDCLILTDDQLRGVMAALDDGMEKGLRKGTRELTIDESEEPLCSKW